MGGIFSAIGFQCILLEVKLSRTFAFGHGMNAEQITVAVDPVVAIAYRAASPDERRKLDLLVNLRLRDATRTDESLEQVMSEISRNAQERGLTSELLKSILDG